MPLDWTPGENPNGKDVARFWSNVRVTADATECWLWLGRTGRGGYGIISWKGRNQRASRLSFELSNGPIPAGALVCHACDNPACVNPAHLHLGTSQSNILEKYGRGRADDRKGDRHPMARLRPTDVLEIRRAAGCGHTHQQIAERFGISRQYAGKIIRGENWSHIHA